MAEISVAIYAQNYVPHLLEKSLGSAVRQSVDSLEIIIVDDCRTSSESKSLKSLYKKLLKSFNLAYGKSVRFLSMGKSIGLADSLRVAAEDCGGKYFTALIAGDSFYQDDSLSVLLGASKNPSENTPEIDLVQGRVIPDVKDYSIVSAYPKAYDVIEKNVEGKLICKTPEDFAERYILPDDRSFCIEGKLFLRSTLVESLSRMPRVRCYCGAEYLWMYFFCRKCTSLVAIEDTVCRKDMEISPDAGDYKIDSPGRWAKICSSASAFSAIFFDLADYPMKSNRIGEYFRSVMSRYAISNVRSLLRVDKSIVTVARALLEDSWGPDIVLSCRNWLEQNENIDILYPFR